jgi:hypothetical protein
LTAFVFIFCQLTPYPRRGRSSNRYACRTKSTCQHNKNYTVPTPCGTHKPLRHRSTLNQNSIFKRTTRKISYIIGTPYDMDIVWCMVRRVRGIVHAGARSCYQYLHLPVGCSRSQRRDEEDKRPAPTIAEPLRCRRTSSSLIKNDADTPIRYHHLGKHISPHPNQKAKSNRRKDCAQSFKKEIKLRERKALHIPCTLVWYSPPKQQERRGIGNAPRN